MKDTLPQMEKIYGRMLMSRSGSDRLKMASDMFDTARALARANLETQFHSEKDIRINLFKRIYKGDFDQSTMDSILARLSKHS